jgi:hypothetical protein
MGVVALGVVSAVVSFVVLSVCKGSSDAFLLQDVKMIVLANKIEHIQSKRQMLFFITNTSHFRFVSSLYHAVGEKSIINAECERKEMVFRELFLYNSLRNQGLGGP